MFITKLLQVTVLACMYSSPMVLCQDVASGLVKGAENLPGSITGADVKRYSLLYNQCSRKHLSIVGKNITALGVDQSPFANMSLETVVRKNTIGLKIMGLNSGRYLCFNKRGKLIARFVGENKRCLFKEVLSPDMYTKFQSLYNSDWFVGFNKKGKPLKGKPDRHKGKRHCFSFIKRGFSYLTIHSNQPGPKMPDDPSKLFAKETEKTHERKVTKRDKKRPFR
ncbi:fibroblast growth factor 17-like isoform X1 [Centruroides vittatus]|uniref:fibroblast growth factor 17-like n=3 Tax=Centruroides TaxID=6875 RepID=UPI000C6E07F1|nr:fibroblast growth factor 17-like [Centruroides sculpturatus]